MRGADEASPLPPVRVRFKLAIPRREVSMRIARPRYEPDPNGINDPLILRDRLYAELRSVSEQCQKLAIAPTSPRSSWRYCRSRPRTGADGRARCAA